MHEASNLPIAYFQRKGQVLLCNFPEKAFKGEMIKRRPVVVISPRISTRPRICTVVPLSTTRPDPPLPYHHKLIHNPQLPAPWSAEERWVKADMISVVSFDRLDNFRFGRDENGKRIYKDYFVSDDDLNSIIKCVLRSLGL